MSRPRGPTRTVTIQFLSWLYEDNYVCVSSPSQNTKGSFGPACPTLSPSDFRLHLPELGPCMSPGLSAPVSLGSVDTGLRRELGEGPLEMSVMAQLFNPSPLEVPKTVFVLLWKLLPHL